MIGNPEGLGGEKSPRTRRACLSFWLQKAYSLESKIENWGGPELRRPVEDFAEVTNVVSILLSLQEGRKGKRGPVISE